MVEPYRNRWDLIHILQKHKGGLTLDEIVENFFPHSESYDEIKRSAVIRSELHNLLETGEVVFVANRYKIARMV